MQRLNAGANLVLAGVKVGLGTAAGSGALVADGLNSTTDLFSNAVAWFGYRMSKAPPDEDHHYGHGNFESVAAAVIGFVILSVGLTVIWRAFGSEAITVGGGLGWAALSAAAVSVVACLWVGRLTLRAGLEEHSPSLVALGRDKRADSLSSGLAFVAVGGSLAGVPWIEPPITVLVGAWIAVMGFRSILEGMNVLMDRVTDPDLRGRLEIAASGVFGVAAVHDVRLHPLGSTYRADLTIGVHGALTVEEGHELAHEVEEVLIASFERLESVVVHVEPA